MNNSNNESISMSIKYNKESSIRTLSGKRKLLNHSRKKKCDNNLETKSLLNNIERPPQLLPPRFEQSSKNSLHLTEKLNRKRRLPLDKQARLKKEQKHLQDADIEKWLETTGRFPETQFRIKEKRALKSWFDRLDRDQSGEIDVQELADPLLSTGLAQSMLEVKRLIRSVDEDNSNGIGFEEFLNVMKNKNGVGSCKGTDGREINKKKKKKKKPQFNQSLQDNSRWKGKAKRRNRNSIFDVVTVFDYNKRTKAKKKKQINPIVQLTEREHNDSIDISSSLCMERRKLLLDATMGEAERRQRAFAKVHRWRKEMKQMKGGTKLKKLRDIAKVVQQMELNKADKENIVQAMKGVLSREMELNPNAVEMIRPVAKTAAQKDSIKRRNVMMLTELTKPVRRNGGRHALAFSRTRTPSIPMMLGIQRQASLSLLKKRS